MADMLLDYNFDKGVDHPGWGWLPQFSAATVAGGASAYDGSRYIYFTHSTQLWRFDTFTVQWQLMATLVAAAAGSTMEYDATRNCLWLTTATTTAWYCFNLNTTALTVGVLVVALAPWTLSAALAPALPTAVGAGSSFEQLGDTELQRLCLDSSRPPYENRTTRALTAAGPATTATDSGAEIHAGMIGCYLLFLTGANAGLQRVITGAANGVLTTAAFPNPTAAGDTYVVEPVGHTTPRTATGGTATTLVCTGEGWPVNVYRDADVVIVAGTGAGQRRRIASNTIDTLTITGAVAGNPRTGPWATAPAADSTFRIVPSTDFLYYTVATNTTAIHRIDLTMNAPTWVAQTVAPGTLGGGHNLMSKPASAPYSLYATRGNALAGAYRYDIGLQTWSTLPWLGPETMTVGGYAAKVPGRNRLFLAISATTRGYFYNFITGVMEPVLPHPYIAGTALDGQRARCLKTASGVEFIYLLRSGGQEFWRLPVEWL